MKNAALLLVSLFSITTFSQLWQHDFSNSGDWISADLNGGSDAWIISSSAIGGSVDSISSATAGNGFAQFNSEGQCNGNHQDVTLTYFQQIDISANALSYVEFVQHYRRKSDTVYVEFSNDGLTWESIRINKEYWYYQQTQNPDTVQVSIPSSVHSQPFWMRFRFSGECSFAWLMDDVKIYEKEQYVLHGNGNITMNGLGYIEIAHCFSDTLVGNIGLTNFGTDTLYDVVIQTDIYLNGVIDFIRFDTIDQLIPEEELNFIQSNLITDPFYYTENFVLHYSIYNSLLDTIQFEDSVLITFNSTKRYSGDVNGYFTTDNSNWGVGNLFICSEFECPTFPRVFIPNNPLCVNQLIWLSYYKRVNGVWEFIAASGDYTVSSGDLGQWTSVGSVDSGSYPEYAPGDTGLVVYTTYGSTYPIPYGDMDGTGSYIFADGTDLNFDPEGHSALIELNPFAGPGGTFECNTCWENLPEYNTLQIIVFPNPALVEVQIENLNIQIHSVKIYSLDGREVYSDVQPDSEIISVSNLQNGTYLIFVETEDGTVYSEKFVKL